MSEHPAIRRAKILAHYGRAAQAADELRKAAEEEPNNTQLRNALQDATASQTKHGVFAGWQHQVIGWLLFAGALMAAVAPVVVSFRLFKNKIPGAPESELLMGIYLIAFIAGLIALLVGGMFVFLWLWFSYLKRLPTDERNFAEGRLAISMNLYSMEPQYSRVRKRMLGSGRADA
ncbi:MAG: hypothetical protein MZW92_60420 [Comamonadaceae bacterium]|nr:hypothetical protein [Comamonadaceae bacterium]